MESTAGPRKRQQAAASASGSAAPQLPEDLIRNILLYLPSKSVLRFRTVCKDWLRIVALPGFALEHHSHQPTLPLVSFLRGAGSKGETETDPVDCFCIDAFDLRADKLRPVVRFTDSVEQCGSFHIHGSCDGLLLLSFDGRFYVCNPATHQWTRLPAPLSVSTFGAFYRHEPTGEYRALFYRGRWPGEDYYIMAADSRKGRGIGMPSEKEGYKFRGHPFGPPVLVRGYLHWMPRQAPQNYAILTFNTATEVFATMHPPVIREHISLVAVGNELAMFSCGGNQITMVELWLLIDYKNEIWVCMHRIRLPAVKVSNLKFDESWRMFFMSKEGVVIVTPEQKLLHFDMNGTLESVPCNGRDLKITPYTFKESLVRHAFFETPDCNADDQEDGPEPPPFFQGL